MTPAARVAAAAEILDQILSGTPAEKALTGWARRSRFAGSKDRAAIRDLVFDALRNRDSFAAIGGGLTGRAVMLGRTVAHGEVVEEIFSGVGHGPAAVSQEELELIERGDLVDLPDMPTWLCELLVADLGQAEALEICTSLKARAPVFLRVNTAKLGREAAINVLSSDGIEGVPLEDVPTAIRVTEGARRIAQGRAYVEGLVELQDASSQSAVEMLPLRKGMTVLDYCSGGGGKALAIAARTGGRIDAYDIDAARMRDLPARAARAGADIRCLGEQPSGSYELVFCDAPCSGSGTWRRAPEMKWRLTEERLYALCTVQAEVLRNAALCVARGGYLAYATCSVFACENTEQVQKFLTDFPDFELLSENSWSVSEQGDGFYLGLLCRQ
jgi:16S rRNA (cytosine967-C5)-methyltransferase